MIKMEDVKEFLNSSTIHGLSYIASVRRCMKLFWILVVIAGFSAAGVMIKRSMVNWAQSPITTSIETHPISEITLPNITVCPPKNQILNLNYDFLQMEKINITNETRKELLKIAVDSIQDYFFEEVISNLSKIEEENRYHNWYHGYTELKDLNFIQNKEDSSYLSAYKVIYELSTSATSGKISTKNFGNTFDPENFDESMFIDIDINVPKVVKYKKTVTLHLSVEKKSVVTNQNVTDKMTFQLRNNVSEFFNENITAPKYDKYTFDLERNLTKDSIDVSKQKQMPGFDLTWHYNKNLTAEPIFYSKMNKEFVRYDIVKKYN